MSSSARRRSFLNTAWTSSGEDGSLKGINSRRLAAVLENINDKLRNRSTLVRSMLGRAKLKLSKIRCDATNLRPGRLISVISVCQKKEIRILIWIFTTVCSTSSNKQNQSCKSCLVSIFLPDRQAEATERYLCRVIGIAGTGNASDRARLCKYLASRIFMTNAIGVVWA